MRPIDAHQHFWRFTAEEYAWIGDAMTLLRRDHLPSDYEEESGGYETICVQARETTAETEWLLELAAENSWIVGVVGWVDLSDPAADRVLDQFCGYRKFRGVRAVLQGQPAGVMQRAPFRRGLGMLAPRGLTYDLLIYENQLVEATELVDAFPDQVFILDHVAKPRIRDGILEPWASQLRELGRRENVFCKLSGLVTEASWATWSPDDLRPYLETALSAFGPRRLIFGSDWPVCRLAGGLRRWRDTVEAFASILSPDESSTLFRKTAERAYNLPLS